MAGTSPAMTVRALSSLFVLDNPPNLGYIGALDLFLLRGALARRRSMGLRGALARRRSMGADTVSWHGLASCADGRPGLCAGGRNWFRAPVEQTDLALNGHRAGLTYPPKEAVREETVRFFHSPITHRAEQAFAPPSINLQARSSRCGPTGADSLKMLNERTSSRTKRQRRSGMTFFGCSIPSPIPG